MADFRSRYNLSIEDIGETYSYKEGVYLTLMLLKNTETWLFAVEHKWKYPASKEYLMQLNTYDLLAAANSRRKPKPVGRPFKTDDDGETKLSRKFNNSNVDQDKVREHLARLGHKPQGV